MMAFLKEVVEMMGDPHNIEDIRQRWSFKGMSWNSIIK
jgi:hypothetical protein